jgi:hypothetical protein
MTYDLSTTISDGYEGLGPVVSKLLHAVTPHVGGKFIRAQGQTQGLNITSMLDGGIRFIDFRIMYTDPPKGIFDREWYCLHGCQTQQPALTYLQEVRAWMDEHPSEILVFWASRHGDNGPTGTDQYPDTTPAQRQQFFAAVASTFGSLMYNASEGSLNATTISTLLARGQRLVWYAADSAESTGNSPLALDGRLIDNQLSGAVDNEIDGSNNQAAIFRGAAARREANKAQNRFYLLSMASSGPSDVVENAALLHFLPGVGAAKHTAACAAALHIPGMDAWCPMTLMDLSLLANYYNQQTLEAAHLDEHSDFPNAIYIDAIDQGGTIRTGTSLINPLPSGDVFTEATEADPRSHGMLVSRDDDHSTTAYAYAASLVVANVKRFCQGSASASPACGDLLGRLEAVRGLAPLQTWDDMAHGRLENWPPKVNRKGGAGWRR